jgi:hypothetical protein
MAKEPKKSGIPPFRDNTVIHTIADVRRPFFETSLINTVDDFSNGIPTKNLVDLIRAGAFDSIDTAIPWVELHDQIIEGNVSAELVRGLTESADAVSALTARAVKDATGVEPVLTFDSQNSQVRKFINEQVGGLITSITKDSRQSVKDIILDSRFKQTAMHEVAGRIKKVIGLRPDQTRSLIKMKDAWKEEGKPQSLINKLFGKARDKKLAQRADMIGRTEMMSAVNGGHEVGWQQAADAGYFDPDKASVIWVVINDGPRLCPTCNSMEAVPRPFKGKWKVRMLDHKARPTGVIKQIRIPSMSHPNCRCTMTLELGDEAVPNLAQDPLRVGLDPSVIPEGSRGRPRRFQDTWPRG